MSDEEGKKNFNERASLGNNPLIDSALRMAEYESFKE